MKIAGAAITMESRHVATTRSQESETLRTWVGQERPDFEGRQRTGTTPPAPLARPPQLSDAARSAQSAEAEAIEQASDAVANDPLLILIRTMLEWMTGKPIKVFDSTQLHAPAPASAAEPMPGHPESAQPPRRAGFGIEYDYHAVYEEFEQTDFSARGTIQTADGQTIDFSLDLTMSRHFRSETDISLRAGDGVRKDPLVINFGGPAAQLSNRRFRFDLAGDGKAVDVPLLAGGSGYLALDLNRNGKIDSGAELFGPASGSGFADLARYDQDGNGWIDENDAVFDKLLVWSPAAKGDGNLATLTDRQVGAFYLGHTATAFELRDGDNRDLGAVRDSGIYVTETGQVGSLQEIDLTV